jgi:DNA-binding transcriptional ArsR family regulator
MPVDPARFNAVGDLVLADTSEFAALGDATRLELFDAIRRQGPVSTATLAEHVGLAPEEVAQHLERLAAIGLVEPGDDGWATAVRGVYFEIPDEPAETQLAARRLSGVMLAKYAELPAAWVRDEEPRLSVEWARATGLFNAGVRLTPDELRSVQDELERVLEPYTNRAAEATPADAANVRVLAYFLPAADRV